MRIDISREKLKKIDADYLLETLTDEKLGPHAHLALLLFIVIVVAIIISIVSSIVGF